MVSSSGSSWGSAQSTIISQLQTLMRPVSNLRLARLAALWDSYSRKQNPLQKQIKIWIWGVKKVWKNLSNWMFSWKSAIYWCFWKVPPLFHNENRRHLWNQEKKKKLVNNLKILANFRGKAGNTEKNNSNYRFFFLSSGEL